METTKHKRCCGRFLIIAPLAVAALFGISAVVMLLWNWVIPAVSTLEAITYWQAMGILVLSKILFGCGHCYRHHRGHHLHHARLHQRFMEMSDEEKSAFKDQWSKRCCK